MDCPRCSAKLDKEIRDPEIEATCYVCGYVQYTPVRTGWFDGDDIFTSDQKGKRKVDIPQSRTSAIKPITFTFRDEKGKVQTITIRRGETDCTCRPWSTDAAPCKHRKEVETYLAVNLIKVA